MCFQSWNFVRERFTGSLLYKSKTLLATGKIDENCFIILNWFEIFRVIQHIEGFLVICPRKMKNIWDIIICSHYTMWILFGTTFSSNYLNYLSVTVRLFTFHHDIVSDRSGAIQYYKRCTSGTICSQNLIRKRYIRYICLMK